MIFHFEDYDLLGSVLFTRHLQRQTVPVCSSVSGFLADFSLDFEVCLQQKSSFLTCPKLEYGVLSQFLKILLLFGSTLWRIFMNFKIKLQLFSVEIFFEEM